MMHNTKRRFVLISKDGQELDRTEGTMVNFIDILHSIEEVRKLKPNLKYQNIKEERVDSVIKTTYQIDLTLQELKELYENHYSVNQQS